MQHSWPSKFTAVYNHRITCFVWFYCLGPRIPNFTLSSSRPFKNYSPTTSSVTTSVSGSPYDCSSKSTKSSCSFRTKTMTRRSSRKFTLRLWLCCRTGMMGLIWWLWKTTRWFGDWVKAHLEWLQLERSFSSSLSRLLKTRWKKIRRQWNPPSYKSSDTPSSHISNAWTTNSLLTKTTFQSNPFATITAKFSLTRSLSSLQSNKNTK